VRAHRRLLALLGSRLQAPKPDPARGGRA
jgi:hypothetical protein